MGKRSRRIKGAAALSITALATAAGVTAAVPEATHANAYLKNDTDRFESTFEGKVFLKKKGSGYATDNGSVVITDVGTGAKIVIHDKDGKEVFTLPTHADLYYGHFTEARDSAATYVLENSGSAITAVFQMNVSTGGMDVTVTDT